MYYIYYEGFHRVDYTFNSLWAATFKARAIFEEHGFSADVIDANTGEVLISFWEDGSRTLSSSIEDESVWNLVLTPLE